MASAVTQLPKSNWVRLELETVQVNLDNDTSLNFATVQSVVPGAHGLYYREDGERKALPFDTNTGKVLPPTSGWEAQPIYIHLAHGSRHGVHFSDYSKANQQFEKNISAVQKLFAIAGMGGHRQSKIEKPRARSQSKKGPKSGYEAQPENVHISDESDNVGLLIEQKDKQVEKLVHKNAELKLRLKETRHDLQEALQKLKEYENKAAQGPRSPVSETENVQKTEVPDNSEHEETVRNLTQRIETLKRENEEKRSHDFKEKDEEINNLHNVIEDLRAQLAKSEKEKVENQNKVGEHEDMLKSAKEKVAYLESQLSHDTPVNKGRSRPPSESHDDTSIKVQVRSLETKLQLAQNSIRTLESEKQKLQEQNWYANEQIGKLEQENGYLKGITDQLKLRADSSSSAQILQEKDKRIWELAEEKSKMEWRMGELTQWWSDAKWKIGELESAVNQQRYLLDTANTKIQNLNDRLIEEVSSNKSSDKNVFSVHPGFQGNWQVGPASAPGPISYQPVPSYGLPPAIPSFVSYPSNSQQFGVNKIRITIEDTEDEVFLTGSFTNWQCALRCEKQTNGKKGVSVDLPRGRYEFRFLVSGQWKTSGDYSLVPNGLGGMNNVLNVD
ncbi:unnamed protein product [Caenorhabditis auriculariae]|uniref:AMP-activated protein kinase glycogen-binding domain-containing protein n=1 Tax=Caenorhabditis auriculariae TaxID=2777116 RepID=A0A8S1H3M1_9PELO|nr:unnamed protein product [Caenorhabditis auriculariae]